MNNIEEVRKILKRKRLAAVFIEPVLVAAGCILAEKDFLKELRELCSDIGTLLIFDEVITGFRLAPGGAQQFFGVKADIVVLGKILGGGFPIGAVAGSREIMEHMDALRYERQTLSFHGGTFCANPVTMTAGLATLKLLEDGKLISKLNRRGVYLRRQLQDIFERKGQDARVIGVGSLWHTHFTKEKVRDANVAARADREKLVKYHMHLLENGIFFSPTKPGSMSTAHTKDDMERLLSETENCVRTL